MKNSRRSKTKFCELKKKKIIFKNPIWKNGKKTIENQRKKLKIQEKFPTRIQGEKNLKCRKSSKKKTK